MKKLIWTPRLYGKCDFEIYLDGDFAREMIGIANPKESQDRMNELTKEDLKIFLNKREPFMFYEDSFLVEQISLGYDGIWLSPHAGTIVELLDNDSNDEESAKHLVYKSHNVATPHEAYLLMMLFDDWVKYTKTFKTFI